MDHISKITQGANSALQNGQQRPESNGSVKTGLPDRMLINLWERMAHIYGHKFTSTYGESAAINGELTDTARTWGSALCGLTGEQIASGLRHCVTSGEAWPPALPEFVSWCGGKTNAKNEYGLTYVPEMYRAQPESEVKRIEKKSDPGVGKSYLEKIKGMVGC